VFAWVLDPELWGALLTLSALEMVLGIDNLTFLSVVVDRLPVDEQARNAQSRPSTRSYISHSLPPQHNLDYEAGPPSL
jgi:hypothetical protein